MKPKPRDLNTIASTKRRKDEIWRIVVVPGLEFCLACIAIISIVLVILHHPDWISNFGTNITVNDLGSLGMAVVALLAASFIEIYRRRLKDGLQSKKALSGRSKEALLAAFFFYVLLFVIAKWFPTWTGYTLKSDWALILIASVPIIAIVLLVVIENAAWIKLKFGDLEIGFERLIPTSSDQSLRLDPTIEAIRKGNLADLRQMAEFTSRGKTKPKVLLVPIGDEEFRVNFIALRQYIYELERVTPLEFIIWIDNLDTYLAFTPVKSFTERYPKTQLEILLEGLEESVDYPIREDIGFLRLTTNDIYRIRETRQRLIRRQWDENMENVDIRGVRDLTRLGALRLKVEKSQGLLDAYRLMVENNLNGIPLVNDRQEYEGIVTKDKIAEEALAKLLEIGRRSEKK